MEARYLLAIDLGKRHFQVCGTDVGGKVLFNRPLSRPKLMELLAGQPRAQVKGASTPSVHVSEIVPRVRQKLQSQPRWRNHGGRHKGVFMAKVGSE